MLLGREFARSLRDLAPTEKKMRKLIRENIRFEASVVELCVVLDKVLSDENCRPRKAG